MEQYLESRTYLFVEQRAALLDIIEGLDSVSTTSDLIACVDGLLQRVFPHGGLACGIANIRKLKLYSTLLHNFPPEAIDVLCRLDGNIDRPLISYWLEQRTPLMLRDDDAKEATSLRGGGTSAWFEYVQKFNFRNSMLHGVIDLQGELASYFFFVRLRERPDIRHTYLLNLLIPHLHKALVLATPWPGESVPSDGDCLTEILLSDRQTEILKWLGHGKTNPEIAQIIGISEANVKYYVREIFSKLNVFNRTQAVIKAAALGIIKL